MRGNLSDDEGMDRFSEWILEDPNETVSFFSDPDLEEWEFEIDEEDGDVRLGSAAFDVMVKHLTEANDVGPKPSLN